MAKIIPIVLCGGSGTRLWPLSRKSYPKQFSKIFKGPTLFQQSITRVSNSEKIDYEPAITVTNSEFRFIVEEQLEEIGANNGSILIEPSARNTAPAILASCIYALEKDPSGIFLVMPSDHLIPDLDMFETMIQKGLMAVKDHKMITFGIKPNSPETGYGYIQFQNNKAGEVYEVKRFIEKPSVLNAKKMLLTNNYFWNSGIFLFKGIDLLKQFKKLDSKLYTNVANAVDHGGSDLNFYRLDNFYWDKCKNISIDYAIMEKSDNLSVVPFEGYWTDLGSWEAVLREEDKDKDGVAHDENVLAFDCKNSLLRSEKDSLRLVGIGLENIVAVAMPDAVLVMNVNKNQELKSAVETLKKLKIQQAEQFPTDHRPWGWFEVLITSDQFQVKKISVHPGKSLSLQSHQHRSEHWVVVEGTATVTI
ncbi:mannose-1-phosphate guanylyltransferase/mannose-6-phosphate isomerase, partial [Paracoccaceae bacterium]|nr:mannose-1-phosphate guanylyltransferase/mannose-6-phosphate isomerase [Paracoccaceae bacterium]